MGKWGSEAEQQNMSKELSCALFQYLFIIYVPKQQEEITSEIPPGSQHAQKWFSLQLALIERCRVEWQRRLKNVKLHPFLHVHITQMPENISLCFQWEWRPTGAVIALRSGDRRGRRNV